MATAAFAHSSIGVAVDPWGNVYVSDEGNHTIRPIAPNGRVTTVAGMPGQPGDADGLGAAARFHRPAMLAIGDDGVRWIADRGKTARSAGSLSAPASKRRIVRQ